MKRYTNKELKELIKCGLAEDATQFKRVEDIPERYHKVGYSCDAVGCSGLLFKGNETGTLYAVTKRTPALWILD